MGRVISAYALFCLVTLVLASSVYTAAAKGKRIKRHAPVPDMLLLGDSQLSFGAGRAFKNFFKDFAKRCRSEETWKGEAAAVAAQSFALMGVKSTSFHHWATRRRLYKKMVCEPDPKWPVNARLYGFPHRKDGRYVQFGRDKSFPFCRKNKSPLEALFDWGRPKLIIFSFLGNAASRWARWPKTASTDFGKMERQLPASTACVVMTTAPAYRRRINRRRRKAQRSLAAVVRRSDSRCRFVPLITDRTIKAIEGNARYFRRKKNGRVKDPYHPLTPAARRLLALERVPICRAVLSALRPSKMAQPK